MGSGASKKNVNLVEVKASSSVPEPAERAEHAEPVQAQAAGKPKDLKRPPRPKPKAAKEGHPEAQSQKEENASLCDEPGVQKAQQEQLEVEPEARSPSQSEATVPTRTAPEEVRESETVAQLAPEELPAACRSGNEDAVKAFLQKVVGPRGLGDCEEALFDVYGESVLHHAVHGSHIEVAHLLLDVGLVQVDIPNARNETALAIACRKGDASMASFLLKADANPNCADSNGLTPFLAAVLGGANSDFLEMLVAAKADVSVLDTRGVGALHCAALSGNLQLMKWLTSHAVELDLQTEHGTSALMLASKRGLAEGVALLLAAKANPNLSDKAGCSALMQAVARPEVTGLLLEGGASVDLVDSAGRNALFHAVISGEVPAVEAVLARGGRINILDEDGRSPLYQACLMGAAILAKLLLAAGADSNLAGRASPVRPVSEEEHEDSAARVLLDESRTCLQVCAMLAHNELMLCLLEHGADINAAPGSLGWSALHLCSAVSNQEGAELLLSRGASALLEDVEGNTAKRLAERAGNDLLVELLSEVQQLPEGVPSTPARRKQMMKGQLPPLTNSAAETEAPEDQELLEAFREEWEPREATDSLLDCVFGPMVHDAMLCEQWRDRLEAHTYVHQNFAQVKADATDLVRAVSEATRIAAKDKMPKVFHAALGTLEELLSDARIDDIGTEDFPKLLHFEDPDPENLVAVLLDKTDVGGGSSKATSPQQAAATALCSCVLHGRVPLDEAAWPLLSRIAERLRSIQGTKDRSEQAKTPKCLAANLKLLGRMLNAFGLQQSGLFRRAIVLPLLLLACSTEHSKVRAASGDCLLQLLALSGGMEERLWSLLPPKARKRIESLASGHEGIALSSAVACDEDAAAKEDIVAEDSRAGSFICASELNQQVWASLQAGQEVAETARPPAAPTDGSEQAGADDGAAEAFSQSFSSKSWQERAESISKLASELQTAGSGVKCLADADGAGATGPLLSQYVLSGLRISMLQAQLLALLSDTVTAVFVGAADLLRLICSHVPLYIAPLFLEPLLPQLFARLLDTSQKVRQKAVETTLEVGALHGNALSEMVVQCVASGSAWTCASQTAVDRNGSDRSAGPRLQLLGQMVKRVQDRASGWSSETWNALAEYALKASENKSAEVRKEAANLLNGMAQVEGQAAEIAEAALAQLKAMADEKARQKMRPGTGVRPLTGTRLGTAGSRPSTGAQSNLGGTGKLSNMGSTGGFTLTMNSSGRLSTANRSRGTGSSFRPGTGRRPGTGMSRATMEDESDNSVHSEAPAVEAEPGPGGFDEGVKFFDVKSSACGGADEVPELAEGEAALKEALPLAEALDEVALDFVAPLIALFGEDWTRCFYSRNWQCRVAALTHLAASMAQRLEELSTSEVSPNVLAELLDGAMRAVHEGLGDQNVRVYAEACMSVTAIVPSFCGTVDGRLLVAHLAPLLRQLCARMGDSKEVVRTQTTQAIFRLLNPPTGNIVSPVAIAMLILRHLMPSKEEGDSPMASVAKGATGKGAATGWLCRLGALRDLCKEHSKSIVQHAGSTSPGEWARLSDGLKHSDPTVRHESVRLFALVCKMHLKSLGDEEAQRPGREAWVAALPRDVPSKSVAQVRRYLKLPEEVEESSTLNRSQRVEVITANSWEVPSGLASWCSCEQEVLNALTAPQKGEEKVVIAALKALGKACKAERDKTQAAQSAEAFAGICRAIQQALAFPVGADRLVFLCAVELCQLSVQQLAASLSGLDLNMALAKIFPTLMERTALSGLAGDVKVGVASDKLVQQLAKHPKVGCEAVTKMVIACVARSERPVRPLVLLRTLLSDFGLRLCAQKDVVMLLLDAVAGHLERLEGSVRGSCVEDSDAIRPQLIAVLATCNQFSSETIRFSLGEVQVSQRKLLCAALAEAPDSRLMALGAAAAEDSSATVAGSAVRAASRSRSRAMSPSGSLKPSSPGPSPTATVGSAPQVLSRHHSRSNLGKPPMDPSGPSGPTRRSDSQKRGERSPSFREVLQPLGPIGTRLDGGQQKMWAPFSR